MAQQRPRVLVDFPLGHGPRRWLGFAQPRRELVATQVAEVRPLLAAAEAAAKAGAWAVGFVAYEAAAAFDRAMATRPAAPLPLAWFGLFDAPLDQPLPAGLDPFRAGPWRPTVDEAGFTDDLAAIRDAIRRGECYQVNHTLRLKAPFAGDDLACFLALHGAQPTGYGAYVDLGGHSILSASPELFFRRDGELITTRPMKGTASRGRWPEEDARQIDWLRQSAKNRAENLMIVDLLRNDLSRLALPGSVEVPALFAVETYPTVHQMTSTVTARMPPGTGLADLFAALFPCGSITGAPKIKAMEWIAALESEARGVYCGSIGVIAPGGDAVFSVAIRTAVIDRSAGTAVCGVGAGITWDSEPADEYREVMLKSRFLAGARTAFNLIETLRLEDGEYWLLDRHLERLRDSARFFAYPFDEDRCRRLLAALAEQAPRSARRVRLTLAPGGALALNCAPLPPCPGAPSPVALAAAPIDANDPLRFHKTSRRQAYEQALARRPGMFDVLLYNQAGELTEFTRGNLLVEIDGGLWTPPLACGLLDGTLRRELLATGAIGERILRPADLPRASGVWFINSLRGRLPVIVVEARAAPAAASPALAA